MLFTVIEERLTRVFRKVFRNESIHLSGEMTADNIDGWDSLTNIDLIIAIQREFGMKFTTGDVTDLKNVGDLIAVIRRKI